jgi:hypothetical protein
MERAFPRSIKRPWWTDNNQETKPNPIKAISIKPPSKTEIITAIRELKKGKAPGIDDDVPEVLKIHPNSLAEIFEPLLREIWEQEELPKERTKGIIIKLPKKGDLTNCNDWRGITLLSSSSKIFSRIILNRIKRHIENKLRREKMGFQEGRSCIDQVNTKNYLRTV